MCRLWNPVSPEAGFYDEAKLRPDTPDHRPSTIGIFVRLWQLSAVRSEETRAATGPDGRCGFEDEGVPLPKAAGEILTARRGNRDSQRRIL